MASSSKDKGKQLFLHATPIQSKKPNEPVNPVEVSQYINLKVKGQQGNEQLFRIKRTTQLKKLMDAYCERQSENVNAVVFLYDGRRLRGEHTPNDLKMEDEDEIDAMLHQTGGSLTNYA